ncbi:universal stress protein [Candidatus Latescibacterota bacterium]
MYSKILVALDGSEYSLIGGDIALQVAQSLGSELLAAHIYDAGLHNKRFQEMELTLPSKYQDENKLSELRETHNDLIYDGFESLSKGYMEQYLEKATKRGVPVTQIHREGRNYLQLLDIAKDQQINLLVLGAQGLGVLGDEVMGSTAQRVLRYAPCDVLITRRTLNDGSIMIGIDGSDEAISSLRKAVVWSRTLSKSLNLVAAYDPHFHTTIFKTMAGSLSPERQEEVGVVKQESLHEEIIDDGLGKLYQGFLDTSQEKCREMGMNADTSLLQGKAYRALIDFEEKTNTDIIVVGRYGNHREDKAHIGSQSELVACHSHSNVLVTKASDIQKKPLETDSLVLEWDEEALMRLERIPSFARPMARKAIENSIRSQGKTRITQEDFQKIAQQFGMGGKKDSDDE